MTESDDRSAVTRRELVKGATVGAVAVSMPAIITRGAEAQGTEDYDAIVIGTGFGGTIATVALSSLPGKKILVIERGTFWLTPETLGAPTRAGNAILDYAGRQNPKMRVQYWPGPDHTLGLLDLLQKRFKDDNRYGLHHYQMFKQAHVLTASGVGGGSLIYSNVNLQPKQPVLDRIGLRLDENNYTRAVAYMTKYRGRLSQVVTKIPLPLHVKVDQLAEQIVKVKDVEKKVNRDYLLLDRSRALRDAAKTVASQTGTAMPWSPLMLSVNEYMEDDSAEADGQHTFCERQGRCMLGCLPAARHTLNKTLYNWVLSKNAQVSLSPESEVQTIRRVGDSYEVVYEDRRGEGAWEQRTVRAKQVFLAAGVLGTTEILLRSRQATGLALSDKLGQGFSTNGDFGALAVGTRMIRDANGNLAKSSVYPTRGPINTCDVRFELNGRHYTIEDCGIPSMFAKIVRTGLDDRQKLMALRNPEQFISGHTSLSIGSLLTGLAERLFGLAPHDPSKDSHSTEAELIDDVFFFNAMGEDDANGILTLNPKGRIDLDWPADKPIGSHPVFAQHENMMQKLSQAMGGTYTPLPTWEGLPGVFKQKTLIVTHPLGGCRIGKSRAEGVVDEFGQVYDGRASEPTGVHPGLFIVDGSVIPGALAANPTLTISAQAIKAVEKAVGPIPM